MRILALADIDAFEWRGPAQAAEVIVSCGDVGDRVILDAARACPGASVFAVKGNHDLPSAFPPPIADVHLRVVDLPQGLRLAGFNGCWRYKPKGHFLYGQDEAAALLRQLPPVDILVTHTSPLGVHERDTDIHQGLAALADYLRRHAPTLLLHGHQHVNQETLVGRTRVVGIHGSRWIEV